MTYVGEAKFSAGMSAYFARHAWGNTTLADLIDALAASSGRDLEAWRAGWLDTAGTDRLTLERHADGPVLVARGPDDGAPRPQILTVGAYRTGSDGLYRSAVARVEVQGPSTSVELAPGADVYLVNDEDLTFATSRLDPETRDVLLTPNAPTLPTAMSRGVAVATGWDMLVSGEAAAAETVRFIAGVLAVETSDSVIEPYLTLAADIAELWTPESERAAVTGVVATTCRDLAKDANRRRVALRVLARTAGSLDEVSGLQAQAGDDVELHWRALARKAEFGADTAAEVAELQERDPDPEAWIQALAVRAAASNAVDKAAAWQTLAIDRTVPIASVSQVARAFWRPGQEHLLAPYLQRYLALVPDLGQGGATPAPVFTSWLFPLFAVDESFVEKAVAAADDSEPVVRKTLRNRADVVLRMVRSRGRSASGSGA
jgi:aminopeptidase N